jgi:pyruvate dehydrogenase E1 component
MLGNAEVPVIAVSDNMAAVPDMIRQWVTGHYTVLGTDGFGRSDTREALRRFFEIDGAAVALAALSSLVRDGSIEASIYEKAEKEFEISSERKDITAL